MLNTVAENEEDLKNKLKASEGACIEYRLGNRTSFLARVQDRILHVDKLGRAAAAYPDIIRLSKELTNKPIIDITGNILRAELEATHGQGFPIPVPPADPQGLIGIYAEQVRHGTYIEPGAMNRFSQFGQAGKTIARETSNIQSNLNNNKIRHD